MIKITLQMISINLNNNLIKLAEKKYKQKPNTKKKHYFLEIKFKMKLI